jgi:hypothetical protein
MNIDEFIKKRESSIKMLIERCITNKHPMVKDVIIKTGKDKCGNLLIPYPYHYYYTISIVYSPGEYCETTYLTIKEDIKFLVRFFFEENEHLKSVFSCFTSPVFI